MLGAAFSHRAPNVAPVTVTHWPPATIPTTRQSQTPQPQQRAGGNHKHHNHNNGQVAIVVCCAFPEHHTDSFTSHDPLLNKTHALTHTHARAHTHAHTKIPKTHPHTQTPKHTHARAHQTVVFLQERRNDEVDDGFIAADLLQPYHVLQQRRPPHSI